MKIILNRLNELAKKEKSSVLTPLEKEEQTLLRNLYIALFRNAFEEIIINTTVIDMLGNDVTPLKVKIERIKRRLD